MLDFYQSFGKRDIPTSLKNDLINSDGELLEKFNYLNKVNIFVGQNNSGKSRIIREILKSESQKYYSDEMWKKIQSNIAFYNETISALQAIFPSHPKFTFVKYGGETVFDLNDFISRRDQLQLYSPNFEIVHHANALRQIFGQMFVYNDNSVYEVRSAGELALAINNQHRERAVETFRVLNESKHKAFEVAKRLENYILQSEPFEAYKTYIPAVRTLRTFATRFHATDETMQEYGFNTTIRIGNGEKLNEEFKAKNSNYERRIKIEKYEKFLSDNFFQGKIVTITYDEIEKKVLLIKIGEETERPIHELGDGLQMIIILTHPFFFHSGGTVAIEEPELFVYPGMQKAFIKFLTEHEVTKNFQIYIATHSNHIVDSINSGPLVSIFSTVKKLSGAKNGDQIEGQFILENVAYGNENLLNYLGITSTSVYLSNCTIWVEGVTDKIYYQKFISEFLNQTDLPEDYKKCLHFREGIHYSFALTGGDMITHWDFGDDSEYNQLFEKIIVRKFCSKAYVIVDNYAKKSPQVTVALKSVLGERFQELPVPEVENLLPAIAIKKTAMTYPTVRKAISDIAEIKFSDEELLVDRIGTLVDREVNSKHPSAKIFSESDKNGSIASGDKLHFCLKSLEFISSNNLTATSIEVVKKVLSFVISQNL